MKIELSKTEVDFYITAVYADRLQAGPQLPCNVYCAMIDIMKQRGLLGIPSMVTVEYYEVTMSPIYHLHINQGVKR